jgi:hypothetical protein
VVHMGTSQEVARMEAREAARMGTSREVPHMAAGLDLIRSRRQQAVAEHRQPPEPHNLAHKMKRESRPCRQICK